MDTTAASRKRVRKQNEEPTAATSQALATPLPTDRSSEGSTGTSPKAPTATATAPALRKRKPQARSQQKVDFIIVVSKAAQWRARALQAAAVVTDSAVVGTALYRPSATGSSFRGSPHLVLAGAALAGRPGVVAVRVNHRRNIVAADAVSPECLRELLTIAELNRIPIIAREPTNRHISTSFVYDVDGDFTNTELLRGIVSAAPVTAATREGGTVKLHFASPSPADCITIFGLQLRVRPVRPCPRQCRQCGHFGHVTEPCQRTGDCVRCGRRHPEADLCKPHCVNCGGAHFATNPICPRWQEERRVAMLMATTPTLLSGRAVRAAVCEERHEVCSYTATLKASLPLSSKAPGQPRTPAPRQLNQPVAPPTELELPAAHPVTPAEDERHVHIRILVTALQYVVGYLPKDHHA
ncbi:hypothetical protein MRX96_004261 [Rhipicephalus microplus]